jgi:hypothetical protein
MVSMAAQKYGADSVQPIGRTRGMATRGSSPVAMGRRHANLMA